MVLPIRAYGDPVLRARARPVEPDAPALQQLIDDLLETMRGAQGAGLAAPQVGHSLRLFVADLRTAWRNLPPEERPDLSPQPMVCINPEIVHESEEEMEFVEGCLSIPGLEERLWRPAQVTLRYLDRHFTEQQIEGARALASVLQHEFDHLDGVLHIDYITPLRKRLIQGRLRRIARGEVDVDYPMQFSQPIRSRP
jgi:peptide deformylase